MPTIDQLLSATTPVPIRRGTIEFTLECALEKYTAEDSETSLDAQTPPSEGVTYSQLRQDVVDAELQIETLGAELRDQLNQIAVLSDLEHLGAVLIAEKKAAPGHKKGAKVVISDEELKAAFEERLKVGEERVKELRDKLAQGRAAFKHAIARRLAFLVVSSDVTTGDGKPCLSGAVHKTPEQLESDAQFFSKYLSDPLLDHCRQEVEKAVFAPLPNGR